MADISVIIEVLGNKEIERATKSMSSLEGRVGSLRTALKQGRISEDQFNQGLREIRRSVDSQFPSWQKAKAAIDSYRKSLDRMDKNKAVEQATQNYQRLAASLDPLERVTQEYQRSVRTLDAALENNVITLDQYNSRLAVVKENVRNAGATFNQFGQIASVGTRRFKRFGAVGMQQVGYQVGDFAVQLQGGTNAAVAFGQQGSQLLGIFGAWGAVAGAALAIITAFAAPMLDMASAADEASDKIKRFEDNLESARNTVRSMADDLVLLRSGFEDAFEKALFDQVELAEEKLNKARVALSLLRGTGASGVFGSIGGQADIDAAEARVRAAKEELAAAREIARQTKEQERSDSIRNQLYEARIILREKEKEAERERAEASLDFAQRMAEVLGTMQGLKEELGDAAYEALRLSNVDMQNGVDAAAKAAARLAARLGVSLERAMQLAKLGTDLTGPTYELNAATGKYQVKGTGPGNPFGNLGFDTGGSGSLGGETSTSGTSSGSGGGTQRDPRAFLESLQRELDLKSLLVGVNEAQAERLKLEARLKEQLLETGGRVTEADRERIAALVKQSEAIRKAEEAEERRRSNIERFENQMSDSITNVVKEAQSIEDAFIGVIRNIVEELFRQNVAKPIASGIGSFIGGLFPNANGNAFSGGRVTAFADGGVVSKPTMFPMANGAGLMGEAGPEAIMPLKRGKGGKLGVSSEGGSQGNVTIHQSFNFVANGDESVKRIIQQEAPKISAMTEKQMINSRRRCGSLKQAFG